MPKSGIKLGRFPVIKTTPAPAMQKVKSLFTAAFFFGPRDLIDESKARDEGGVDGAGTVVAVLDSGCASSHPAFSGRVLAGMNFTDIGGTSTDDTTGHGTAVSGLVAASESAPIIAPGAKILPLKVFAGPGQDDLSFLDDALDWLINNAAAKGVSVVCLSMGDDGNYQTFGGVPTTGGQIRQNIAGKIRTLRGMNIPTVTAAGNGYCINNGQTAGIGMCFPAIMPECISVGAAFVTNMGNAVFNDYGGASIVSAVPQQMAPFSQRLPSTTDGIHFTRIFAPGADIRSLGTTTGATPTDPLFGTSIAVPIVAGVVALLQSRHLKTFNQSPTCRQVENWLVQGSRPISDNAGNQDNVDNTGEPFPFVNALGAMRLAKQASLTS